MENIEKKDRFVLVVLKLSIIVPFLYAATSSTLRPNDWISFIPGFVEPFIDTYLALKLFSALQVILGVLIIWGKWLPWTAFIAGVMLLGIVFTNLSTFGIAFRDLGLAFSAFGLALYARRT